MPAFSAAPETRWLDTPAPDRKMALLEAFWFEDRAGKRWTAKKEAVVDGASIPRPLWSIVGSPYTGLYRRASIVHDVACDEAKTPADRRAADRMFYEACREGGCTVQDALILYLGVRIGALWPQVAAVSLAAGPRVAKSAEDRRVEGLFQLAGEALLRLPLVDDAADIEAKVDQALSHASALMPA